MLRIKFSDLYRATLPARSGNEGWIGVSPDGDAFHVVVPVDTQIARGVMACNRPSDGTPFGGYANWLYFRCPPFEHEGANKADNSVARVRKARETAEDLIKWLASYGIVAEIEAMPTAQAGPTRLSHAGSGMRSAVDKTAGQKKSRSGALCSCPGCGTSWDRLGAFLRDPGVKFDRYRACLDDFGHGVFVFVHRCGRTVEIDVARFARPRTTGRNLAGTHACP